MDHRLQLVLAVSAALVSAVLAAPAATADTSSSEEDVVYDQRQNGSENLRINLSDLTIVLAPGDSLSPMVSDAYAMMLVSALRNKSTSSDCGDGGRCKSASRSAPLHLLLTSLP